MYPHIASQVFVAAENCPTFPMNTTRTAQYLSTYVSISESKRVKFQKTTYAAAEARISWRLALVSRDKAPEKINVKTSSTTTTIAMAVPD
jgi:hypothetical protein